MQSKTISDSLLNNEKSKWIKLKQILYQDPNGQQRQWEMCERTTRKGSLDAVSIIPILKSANKPTSTLLVSQFRPPVGKKVIELPAGLVDENETAEEAAIRELKEETGYYGQVIRSTGEMVCSPGILNETLKSCTMLVDLDDPLNSNPQPQCDDGEFIETHIVPFNNLKKELDAFHEKGYEIDERVIYLMEGMRMQEFQ